MTIEAQLQELIDTNKAILAAIQSGAQIAASTGEAEQNTTTRKRRTKAEIEADKAAEAAANQTTVSTDVVDGDPAGTLYWVNPPAKFAFAQLPGEAAPTANSPDFKQVSAAEYLKAKAEYEAAGEQKKEVAATTQQASATTEPSATAQQGTASVNTSASTAAPTWDEVVIELKALAQDPAHGPNAVRTIMKQFKADAAAVNDLQVLGKNAEIVAAVAALRNPAAAAGEEKDPLFG